MTLLPPEPQPTLITYRSGHALSVERPWNMFQSNEVLLCRKTFKSMPRLLYRLDVLSCEKRSLKQSFILSSGSISVSVISSFFRYDRQVRHFSFMNEASLSTRRSPAATVSSLTDSDVTSLENHLLSSMTQFPFFLLAPSLHFTARGCYLSSSCFFT